MNNFVRSKENGDNAEVEMMIFTAVVLTLEVAEAFTKSAMVCHDVNGNDDGDDNEDYYNDKDNDEYKKY